MRSASIVFALLFAQPLTMAAAPGDPDTPAEEGEQKPEVVAAITGRFLRNPPLLDEMRLKRASDRSTGSSDAVQAAIALDHVGRGDEAIALMEKIIKKIEGFGVVTHRTNQALSRYYAYLGTFLANRAMRQGIDRARIGEIEAARDEIARALKKYRRGAFSREQSQLRMLEWIINPPKMNAQGKLPNLLGFDDASPPTPMEAHEAVQGLIGLIELGGIWENVDGFNALGVALRHDSVGASDPRNGFTWLADLAWLRCHELIDAGQGSMVSDAPKGEALKALLPLIGPKQDVEALRFAFPNLRREADAWRADHAESMVKWLKDGHDPEEFEFERNHPSFPPPGLPTLIDRTKDLPAAPERPGPAMPALVGLVIALMLASLLAASGAAVRRSQARLGALKAFEA